MAENEMDTEGGEASNSQRPNWQSRQTFALVLLDCSKPMFVENAANEYAFGKVMQAAYNFYDLTLTKNQSSLSHLAIMLWHPDGMKNSLAAFNNSPADNYKKLFQLSHQKNEDLVAEYSIDNSPPLAEYLLKAIKEFPTHQGNHNILFMATATSDPTDGDSKERISLMRQIGELSKVNVHFTLLPLVNSFNIEPFYREVYETIGKPIKHYYYDVDSLTDKFKSSVEYLRRHMMLPLRPFKGSEASFSVLLYGLASKKTLTPNIRISKETREPISKEITYSNFDEEDDYENNFDVPSNSPHVEYYARLETKTSMTKTIPPEVARSILATEEVPMGITLLAARMMTDPPYARKHVYIEPVKMVRQSGRSGEAFKRFWESMKDLRLLVYVKKRNTSKIHTAEMEPVLVNNERHFTLKFIPNVMEVFHDFSKPPIVHEQDEESSYRSNFETIIREMEIEDFDLREVRPYKFARQVEYFKKEILGAEYTDGKVVDFVNDTIYSGSGLILAKTISELPAGPEKKTRRKQKK